MNSRPPSRSAFSTPENYLQLLEPQVRESFTPEQRNAIQQLLRQVTSPPSAKIVDLRFTIDLILARYYIVLLLGRDRRSQKRTYVPRGVSRIGNIIAATFVLLSINLLITISIILGLYLVKSFIGIDLTPGHFSDAINLIR